MRKTKKNTTTQSKIVKFLESRNQTKVIDANNTNYKPTRTVVGGILKAKQNGVNDRLLNVEKAVHSIISNKSRIEDSDDDQPCTSKKALERISIRQKISRPVEQAKKPTPTSYKRIRHVVADTDESDVASDVESVPCPAKRLRTVFKLAPPHDTNKAQDNTMFVFVEARKYNGEVKYPVTFATFKKYINMYDVVMEVSKIIHNGGLMNFEDLRDKEETIMWDFYKAFYLFPVIRKRFKWSVNSTIPAYTRKRILEVPKREVTKFDRLIEHQLFVDERDDDEDEEKDDKNNKNDKNNESNKNVENDKQEESTPQVSSPQLSSEIEANNARSCDRLEIPRACSSKISSNSGSTGCGFDAPSEADEQASLRKQFENLDESIMPVTMKEFQEFTNAPDVLQIFMKNKYKDTLEERLQTKRHKNFELFVEKVIYGMFYTSPLSRFRWPLQFLKIRSSCPDDKRKVIFNIPEQYHDDSFVSRLDKYKSQIDLHLWFPLKTDALELEVIPVAYHVFRKFVLFDKRYNEILSYIRKCLPERDYNELISQNDVYNHLLLFHYQYYYLDKSIRAMGNLNFKPCPKTVRDQLKMKPKQILEAYEKFKENLNQGLIFEKQQLQNIRKYASAADDYDDSDDLLPPQSNEPLIIINNNNNNENKENSNLSTGEKRRSTSQILDSLIEPQQPKPKSQSLPILSHHSKPVDELSAVSPPSPHTQTSPIRCFQTPKILISPPPPSAPPSAPAPTPTPTPPPPPEPTSPISEPSVCASPGRQNCVESRKEALLAKLQEQLPLIRNFLEYEKFFPIDFKSFTKYAKLDNIVDDIIDNLTRLLGVEEFLEMTEQVDLRERTSRYVYEQFYINPEARKMLKIRFKQTTPAELLQKLNQYAKIIVADDNEGDEDRNGDGNGDRDEEEEGLESSDEVEASSTHSESSNASVETVKLHQTQNTTPNEVNVNLTFVPKHVSMPQNILCNYLSTRIDDTQKVGRIIEMAKERQALKQSNQNSAAPKKVSGGGLLPPFETILQSVAENHIANHVDALNNENAQQLNLLCEDSLNPLSLPQPIMPMKVCTNDVQEQSLLRIQTEPKSFEMENINQASSLGDNNSTQLNTQQYSQSPHQDSHNTVLATLSNVISPTRTNSTSELEENEESSLAIRLINTQDELSEQSLVCEIEIEPPNQNDLDQIVNIFFQPVSKVHRFSHILATTYGLQQRIFKAITEFTFEEFLKYTRIVGGEGLYCTPNPTFIEILKRFYEFAFVDEKTFPVNLYIPLKLLLEMLKDKEINIESFDLSYILPTVLHWVDLLNHTKFVHVVYLETFKAYEDGQLITDCNDYYVRCWEENKWLYNRVPEISDPLFKNQKIIIDKQQQLELQFLEKRNLYQKISKHQIKLFSF